MNYAARVYVGYVNDDIAGFVAVLPQPGMFKDLFRISRCVVLPDFQGLGLITIMNEYIGELNYNNKKRLSIVTTHPGLIKSYLKSNRWKLTSFDNGVKSITNFNETYLSKRLKASFLYIPKDYKETIWDIL